MLVTFPFLSKKEESETGGEKQEGTKERERG